MGIPETKIIEGQVYNKVKEYPNFVLYRNKNGISECFGYFELQQKNQQGKYYKGNLIKKLYR